MGQSLSLSSPRWPTYSSRRLLLAAPVKRLLHQRAAPQASLNRRSRSGNQVQRKLRKLSSPPKRTKMAGLQAIPRSSKKRRLNSQNPPLPPSSLPRRAKVQSQTTKLRNLTMQIMTMMASRRMELSQWRRRKCQRHLVLTLMRSLLLPRLANLKQSSKLSTGLKKKMVKVKVRVKIMMLVRLSSTKAEAPMKSGSSRTMTMLTSLPIKLTTKLIPMLPQQQQQRPPPIQRKRSSKHRPQKLLQQPLKHRL